MAKKKKTQSTARKTKKSTKAKRKPADSMPECPMPKPLKQHDWLQQLVGKWTFEAECNMGPGQEPMKGKGTETVRSIGGLWIHGEGRGRMPGAGPYTCILELGYDPQKKRFVGSWIASMMTQQWLYEGKLDRSGKVLTLNTEGPHITDPSRTAKYRDVIVFKNRNRRELKSQMLGDNGKWQELMTARYTRKK